MNVSNHFYYSDFGVCDNGEFRHHGRRYICTGTPGTGFIERESESHSYNRFVRRWLEAEIPSWWAMVTGREPNYGRELKRANIALREAVDPKKREILECYTNALTVGQGVEYMQRVVKALKNKMGHHKNKHMVSIVGRYKRIIENQEGIMHNVEYKVAEHYSPEVYEAYLSMCEAFVRMISSCRRIWHHDNSSRDEFAQVFFDMGVFDFISAEHYLPLMRDSHGVSYYLLPDAVLVGRSSVDFDLVPLKNMTVVVQEMAIEEPTELINSHLIDAACMIQIPSLDLAFYFNHMKVVFGFVDALNNLKSKL